MQGPPYGSFIEQNRREYYSILGHITLYCIVFEIDVSPRPYCYLLLYVSKERKHNPQCRELTIIAAVYVVEIIIDHTMATLLMRFGNVDV